MSATELQFRTSAFGGFHKQDVLSYIEASGREHAARLEAVQKELEEARKTNTALEEAALAAAGREGELSGQVSRLTEALEERSAALADARAELERRERRIAGLETELAGVRERLNRAEPEAEAYERIKNRTAGVELEAHRRAQAIQEQAREEADRLHRQVEQWLQGVERTYGGLRAQVETAADHTAQELRRANDHLERARAQMGEQEEALAALRRSYGAGEGAPKVEPPMPIPEGE